MRSNRKTVKIEYHGSSWFFVDGKHHKVKFDQALVDATYISTSKVEGYVVAVHGVDQEIAQYFDSITREALGIRGVHSLGRGPTLRRIRLLENGTVEKVDDK